MMPFILTEDYNYLLPEERIAQYPLPERDHSKLLIYHNDGTIAEDVFYNLSHHIGNDYLLVRNNTKVIPVRLKYKKQSGGEIEIFCLQPLEPSGQIQEALLAKSSSIWQAMIGHQKKWPQNEILTFNLPDAALQAELLQRGETAVVKFSWYPSELSFAEILDRVGQIPIPPYLNRSAEESDTQRYQTVYAQKEGSVAAPTAGLHFTQRVIDDLIQHKNNFAEVTLHVGAGTFKPITVANALDHLMHAEPFSVDQDFLIKLKANLPDVVAVGTTSMRCIESLYWLGLAKMRGLDFSELPQFFPYEQNENTLPSGADVLSFLIEQGNFPIQASTRLMIVPGYRFRFCKGLLTNFHQPKSSLLMLIAATVGDDWKRIYDYAMQHHFRFLSYGDSSLLWVKQE